MEKIWIKKDLYILNYEFLKFYAFSWFFIWFLFIFSLLKSGKRGFYLPVGWRGVRDHLEGATRHWGHVAEPGWPARGAEGA